MRSSPRLSPLLPAAIIALLLAGCGMDVQPPPEVRPGNRQNQRFVDRNSTISGTGGGVINLGGSSNDQDQSGGGGGIGVNAYLWRGSLETINFIPLASADPFGGLIVTDWYRPSETPDERLKVQVLIRDTALRADGVKVTVLRQVLGRGGEWLDAPADPQTGRTLEDKILTRARELRVAAAQ